MKSLVAELRQSNQSARNTRDRGFDKLITVEPSLTPVIPASSYKWHKCTLNTRFCAARLLNQLQREPCDREAIVRLAALMDKETRSTA
ncbi:hypothetical protein HAP48_0005430 [Bradyrhizobium septentrionale]|uniref:Uncharacterized protein n=1 Tax=Bradyrhizobium septentrionale TaxID=1404411 RepID=A0A973W6J5_9BRAD|nr:MULTISPECIES: hypothetical protein [Bradyrhizobium]MCK7667447.1 hypothetical protein [Bradyrhizobium sp. 2S1]UGY16929.1 hypothetical protein HAP48_0005430 [Bradyrhizobium septentrionale]UGY25684.1 hypothetical protein HU675_0002200 [Bradyrhizobium septentrionale]